LIGCSNGFRALDLFSVIYVGRMHIIVVGDVAFESRKWPMAIQLIGEREEDSYDKKSLG
jgi:hypothetical protein